jgi:outer membrane protein OmpA-like peptidoglycan-associated protein
MPAATKKTEPARDSTRTRTAPPPESVRENAPPAQADSLKTPAMPRGTGWPGVISQEIEVVKTRQIRFHFEFNSADLDEESEALLEEFRFALTLDPDLHLKVEGFTDNLGHEHFNQRLSLKRANSVCDFLKRSGVESERLQAIGRGEEEPLNENATEAERALNRRVVLTLYRKQ